ncbi:MAG: Fic family protein [Peptococcaceae bacterium]|nr:Fic family protein [Peptococcaceae bacterium]
MKNIAGYYKTNLSGELAYESFVPAPLPPDMDFLLSSEMVALLVDANAKLAALDSLATHIPSVPLFVSMYVRKEALLSSQIEGTQATLEDVLDPNVADNANRDVTDVVNYVRATEFAIDRLATLPLCNRLIKETHGVLMQGVRGQEKYPGEFRRSQNWIGGQGSSLKTARYIPPNPEDMVVALDALEQFINADDAIDPLVKAALIHYQFETIHPFLDGNGRVGRLMITLFLMERKVLTTPALYVSYFLKRNRIEYYDRMTEVRAKGNYAQWVQFFLQAFLASAADAITTIDALSALHTQNLAHIGTLGRASKTARRLFDYLEKTPIIDITKTAAALGLSYSATARAVAKLEDLHILTPTTNAARNRTFSYSAYLEILKKDTE